MWSAVASALGLAAPISLNNQEATRLTRYGILCWCTAAVEQDNVHIVMHPLQEQLAIKRYESLHVQCAQSTGSKPYNLIDTRIVLLSCGC